MYSECFYVDMCTCECRCLWNPVESVWAWGARIKGDFNLPNMSVGN